MSIPNDVKEDILLACRYGELEDVQAFVEKYGEGSLSDITDENGNTILHMAGANGHAELLDFILSLVPSQLFAAQNLAGATALHWAALNQQLEVARMLVLHPNGPGRDLIDIKNDIGRSPLGEAEVAGWDEGAKLFVEMMILNAEEPQEKPVEGDELLVDGENHETEAENTKVESRIAKMSLSGSGDLARE